MAYGIGNTPPDPPEYADGYWDAERDDDGTWHRVWVLYEEEEADVDCSLQNR